MAANCALYPHNWAVWGGFNKINKLTGRPPPAPEARGGQSLTKDQFVIALASSLGTGGLDKKYCSTPTHAQTDGTVVSTVVSHSTHGGAKFARSRAERSESITYGPAPADPAPRWTWPT